VVKANAYGHGSIPISRAALLAGATRLAVHRATEGVELRSAKIEAPILIMGYTPPSAAETIARWKLTPSLMTLEFAQALSSYARMIGVNIPVHIKVDTGMSRYGLMPGEVIDFIRAIKNLPAIKIEGIFTHLATADSIDQKNITNQLTVFNDVLSSIHAAGYEIPLIHAANSAAVMKLPEAHYNAVRPGICLYGMDPSKEWKPNIDIHPVLCLKSIVSRIRELPQGAGVSYGRTFVTQRPTRVALIPIGYGDGYHRLLSNNGWILVNGCKTPILGRVCMDQIVVDITNVSDVKQDDEVVIIGRQGPEQIRAEDVAEWAGTINYEITTTLLPRVTRVYQHCSNFAV
jgi:alanine racemase